MLQLCIFSLVLHKNIFTLPIKGKKNSITMTFVCCFPPLCKEIGAFLGAESQGTSVCTWRDTKALLGSNAWPRHTGFLHSLTLGWLLGVCSFQFSGGQIAPSPFGCTTSNPTPMPVLPVGRHHGPGQAYRGHYSDLLLETCLTLCTSYPLCSPSSIYCAATECTV